MKEVAQPDALSQPAYAESAAGLPLNTTHSPDNILLLLYAPSLSCTAILA